ncbi:multidrug transporter [Luteitalea sp. TBR-22]|uniref:DMT family transporter n=1 Tax=Luteitalea sp. TBR-22 TaxID=2802971 RepID=UPI001AF9D8C3|nr:multidrug efflux SMR transporter [Luteitalea sp. TBR-22]BCS34054.1 multidrug transporter [Luteitalea sp. TBR-22]
MTPWGWLLIAGSFEIAWAIGLKYTDGWTRPGPSLATLALLAASMYCLAVAARSLPIGTAYAVWTGIGAAGTALLGMLLLGEPRTPLRLASLGLILLGVAGLKLAR